MSQSWQDRWVNEDLHDAAAWSLASAKSIYVYCRDLDLDPQAIDSFLAYIEANAGWISDADLKRQEAYYFSREMLRLSAHPVEKTCNSAKSNWTSASETQDYPHLLKPSNSTPHILKEPSATNTPSSLAEVDWIREIFRGDPEQIRTNLYALSVAFSYECLFLNVGWSDMGRQEISNQAYLARTKLSEISMSYSLKLRDWEDQEICDLAESLFNSPDNPYPDLVQVSVREFDPQMLRWVRELSDGEPEEIQARYLELAMYVSLKCPSLDMHLRGPAFRELVPLDISASDEIRSEARNLFVVKMRDWHERTICMFGEKLFVSHDGPYPGVLVSSN